MAQPPLWICALLTFSIVTARADEPAKPVRSEPSFIATLTDQTRVEGKLGAIQLDPSGTGTLTIVGEAPRTVSLLELVKVTQKEPVSTSVPPGAPLLVLPGRDHLLARIGAADATSLEVAPLWAPDLSVRVPLDRPLGVIFNPPADRKVLSDLTQALRDPKRAGETLWLGNGDRKEGSFLGLDGERLQFDSGAGLVAIDRSTVTALGFDPALAQYPDLQGPYLELLFADGSRLGASACRLDGPRLVFKTRFDAELAVPLSSLVSATVLNGSVSYLADRVPDAAQFVPYLDRHPMLYGHDQTWDGYPLRLGGISYERGLGTLPRTLLAYRLEPTDRRFQALIGQDSRAGELGSLVFRVLVDRKEVYVSPPMSRRDTPIPIDLDVTGGRLLILITEFGERGDVQDSGDWADARMIRGGSGSR